MSKKFTLAIESGIQGGSVSLFKNDQEIDFWIGKAEISKAEDLLDQISVILKNNNVPNPDLIAVSNGPGSATGLRIGLATALGLTKALNSRMVRVPFFQAVLFDKKPDSPLLLAVSVGKKMVAWQIVENISDFQTETSENFELERNDIFQRVLTTRKFSSAIINRDLESLAADILTTEDSKQLSVMNDKLASYIGLVGNYEKYG